MTRRLPGLPLVLLLSAMAAASAAQASPLLQVQTQTFVAQNIDYGNPEITLSKTNTNDPELRPNSPLQPFDEQLGTLQEVRFTATGYINDFEFKVNNEYMDSQVILKPTAIYIGFQIFAVKPRSPSQWLTSVLAEPQSHPTWSYNLEASEGPPENETGLDVSDYISAPEDISQFAYYLNDASPEGNQTTHSDLLRTDNLNSSYFSILPSSDLYNDYFRSPLSLRVLPDALAVFDITTTPGGDSIDSSYGSIHSFLGTGDITLTVSYLYLPPGGGNVQIPAPASLSLLGLGLLGLLGHRPGRRHPYCA